MADDVSTAEAVGLDETIVGLRGSPADDGGRVLLVREAGWVVTLVEESVNDDVIDVAVSGDGSSRHEGRDDGRDSCDTHFCWLR